MNDGEAFKPNVSVVRDDQGQDITDQVVGYTVNVKDTAGETKNYDAESGL